MPHKKVVDNRHKRTNCCPKPRPPTTMNYANDKFPGLHNDLPLVIYVNVPIVMLEDRIHQERWKPDGFRMDGRPGLPARQRSSAQIQMEGKDVHCIASCDSEHDSQESLRSFDCKPRLPRRQRSLKKSTVSSTATICSSRSRITRRQRKTLAKESPLDPRSQSFSFRNSPVVVKRER